MPRVSQSICTNTTLHYDDVIMGTMASQITSLTIVYSTVYSDTDQRKHQSSASLAFVQGIHRGPVNSPHKWPVTRKIFPFHDVIVDSHELANKKILCIILILKTCIKGAPLLTHSITMPTHYALIKSSVLIQRSSKWLLLALICSVPSLTIRNKSQWNLNQNTKFLSDANPSENVV